MAAVTAAVVTTAASAYAANKQSGAAKDAARAQTNAANMGIAEQQRQFDQTQQNLQPYMGLGNDATGYLSRLLEGDMTAFREDPGYQFRLGQGLQAQDRSAAARGGLFSGGHQADLINYGQGMASQEYGNYWDRLMGVASIGANAASGLGQLGQNKANAVSGLYGDIGNAQAGSAINQANAWSNAADSAAGAWGNYFGNRSSYQQPSSTSPWGSFTPTGWSSGLYDLGGLGPSNGQIWNFGGGGN